jgi:hypothetical protein
LVYENAAGELVSGVPWAALALARREFLAAKPKVDAAALQREDGEDGEDEATE